ncbi:inactive protein kinase [Dorcoceras hygrometricum]|uniref:Inactive protein kinase n=1 Tax=Dorcoceras hygrometricum TaxID=472368 RepID=A0A2Z7A8V0_9LAMI|nr:inactive protein kinase [Dorcoceras hygrometricum]
MVVSAEVGRRGGGGRCYVWRLGVGGRNLVERLIGTSPITATADGDARQSVVVSAEVGRRGGGGRRYVWRLGLCESSRWYLGLNRPNGLGSNPGPYEHLQMSPSVFSVAGVGTSSFGLVGTTSFWISEGNSALSSVGLQFCERSDVALRTDVDLSRDTLATVHRTLSSSITDGRQLRLKCEICIARTQFVVIVAQILESADSALDVSVADSAFVYVADPAVNFSDMR